MRVTPDGEELSAASVSSSPPFSAGAFVQLCWGSSCFGTCMTQREKTMTVADVHLSLLQEKLATKSKAGFEFAPGDRNLSAAYHGWLC